MFMNNAPCVDELLFMQTRAIQPIPEDHSNALMWLKISKIPRDMGAVLLHVRPLEQTAS